MSRSNSPTIYAERFFALNSELFAPYLALAGLDERILSAPDVEIPAANYIELWEIVGRRVDASIGLRIGMKTESSAFGAYGHAVRSAPTMQLMLRCLSHFIVVLCQAVRVTVDDDGRLVVISYQVTDLKIVQRRQDAEFSISVILSLLREVTQNRKLVPLRADFEHDTPADLAVHRELFRCPVHFNQADNRLYFSRDLLNIPVRTGDPRMFQALQPFLEEQQKIRGAATDLISRLGHHIASSLGSGGATLEQVAASLSMSPRTLQRRLAEHRVEFSDLVEGVRRSLAETYVAQTEYSFTEVALLVGYSETSSFSRAFRRWTRLAPQEYRLQAKMAHA